MFSLKKVTVTGTSYPLVLTKEEIYESTSYVKVIRALAAEIEKKKEVESYEVHSRNYDVFEVYARNGSLIYKTNEAIELAPFSGMDTPKFQEGEIVEVKRYNKVVLGFVTKTPPTIEEAKSLKLDQSDAAYLVDFSTNTDEHTHPYEHNLARPRFTVPRDVETSLQNAYKEIKSKKQGENK